MSWINEAAEGIYQITAGQTVEGFQPLDFFHFYPLWYDLWVERNVQALEKIQAFQKSYSEMKDILPVPSNMRALIQKAVPAYLGMNKEAAAAFYRYSSFIARMLTEACPNDPFGRDSTPAHTQKEVRSIVDSTSWQTGSIDAARLSGRLLTAAGSLVHGLYNDVVTDFGWETYGPYPHVMHKGKSFTLLIRHFPNLQPKELWNNDLLASVKEIKIFQLYENVTWKISCVGCHTMVTSGKPLEGLRYFSVTADGIAINQDQTSVLVEELGKKAGGVYEAIRQLQFEELKKLVMLQECYQFKKIYDSAGMDWTPTLRMYERIKDKPLLSGIIPHGVFISDLKEFKQIFGYNKFETEVLNNKMSSAAAGGCQN